MAIKTLGEYVKENQIDMNKKYTTQQIQDITWTNKQKKNLTRYQPKKKEPKGNVLTRTIATIDDAFVNMSKGFLKTNEGIADTFSYLLADITDFFGADEYADELRKQTSRNLIDELYDNSKTVKAIKNEAYQNKYVTSVEEGIGNVAAMAGGAKVLSWANVGGTTSTLTTSFTSAYGNSTSEALRNGADLNTARKAGLINGTAEALSEQFFDALPGMKVEGWGSKVIGKIGSGVERYFGSNTGKIVMKVLNASGEGFEEIISNMLTSAGNDIMHHFDKNYTYGMENQSGNLFKDVWKAATSKESWDSFISAALTSAITNGGNTLVSNAQKNQIIKSYAKENNMTVKQVKDMFNQSVQEKTQYQIQQQPKMNLGEQVETEQQAKMMTLDELKRGTYVQPGTETQKYQYKETDNEKVNNVRKSLADLKVNNSFQTREMANTAERLARDLGIDIEFTNNEKMQSQMSEEQKKETQGRIVNGFVDKNTGKMYLNVDSNELANFTIGHETKHFFEANEELNDVLNKALKEYAQLKGRYDEDLARITKTYTDKNGNLIADPETELMADYVGEFFTDYDFVSNLSTKNPSLFKRAKDFFQKLYYKATGQQEKLLLKQINDNLNKAYREYAKNQPNANISSNEIQEISQKEETKQEIKKKVKPKEEIALPIAEKTQEKQEVVKKQEKKVEVKEKPQVKKENVLTKEEQEELEGLQAAEEAFGNEGQDKVRYDYLMDKKNGNLKYPGLKTDTKYQDIRSKYTQYKNNMSEFNSDLLQQAKDFVPGYRNTEKRTKQQWLDVAEMIGKRSDFKTDAELEKYAIQSWFKSQPNQKGNLNRQGQKFVKFTIEDWINSVYKGAGVGERIDNSIQYSLSQDNQGRELTKEQQEYFKDSKVRDENGNLAEVYHMTDADFTKIDFNKNYQGVFWFASNKQDLLDGSVSATGVRNKNNTKIMELYANITNPAGWNEYDNYGIGQLKEMGYDGVILKEDDGSFVGFVFDKSNQIKNVDNTNPTSNSDIRYSLSEDNKGRELSKEQQEFFKDVSPEMKDDNGNLIRLYHGSNAIDTTIFTKDKFGDKGITFLTNDEDIADTYRSKDGKRYEFYANIKNPYIVEGNGKNWNDILVGDNPTAENMYNSLTEQEKTYLTDLAKKMNDMYLGENLGREQSIEGFYQRINAYDENLYDRLAEDTSIRNKIYDAARYNWNDTYVKDLLGKRKNTNQLVKEAYDSGEYDGVIFKDIVDRGTHYHKPIGRRTSNVYVVFNSNQIKNIDNLNPTESPDIRYSLSKNENGETELNLYHGTSLNAAFKIQKYGMIPNSAIGATSDGSGDYNYFTNSRINAESYKERKDRYSGQLLRVKKTDDMLIDDRIEGHKKGEYDFRTKRNISPDEIQILTYNGYWTPITNYDLYTDTPKNEKIIDKSLLYDDDGNKVNLETTPTDNDAKYNLSQKEDTDFDELSEKQIEYFKNTKAVDKHGYLETVYHGTPKDFNIFDIEKAGETGVEFGNGFYFTNSQGTAMAFTDGGLYGNDYDQVKEGYINIEKPASRDSKTMSFNEFKKLYNALNENPNMYDEDMDMSNIDALLSDYGDIYNDKENTIKKFYDSYDNDVNLIDNLSYIGNPAEMYKTLRDTTGYDGIIIDDVHQNGGYENYYVAFNPDQFKLKSNKNPSESNDMRYLLSQEGENLESYYQDLLPIKNKVTTRLSDLKRKEVELPTTEEKPVRLSKNEQKQANEIKEEYLPLVKDNDVLRVDAENIAKEINKTGDFDTTKQRKWIKSLKNSDAIQDKSILKDLDMSKLSYEVQTNQKSLDRANDYIENNGYENSLNHVKDLIRSEKTPTATDVALLQRMTQEAIKNKDYQTAQELIMDTAILGTDLGQAVQAMSIIQKLTPEGQLKLYTKMVNRAKIRGEKAFTDVEITPDMVETVLGAYNEDGTYDQKDLTARVEKFKQDIATQMKSTVGDKMNAWRYLSMLGNPKTHIRNVMSNIAMKGTIKVKNTIARTLETILPIKERTKTFEKASKEIKSYAKDTAAEMKGIITGENKYNEKVALEQEKQIFKTKALEKISRFNSEALEAEDWFFSRSAFESNLSEYLTAKGIKTMEDIKNNPEIVEKAKIYAVQQAEIATFRQYSKLASEISRIERNGKLSKYAINAVLPFKKTPINVAKAGFNYSPLGLIKNISYDAYQLKQGNINGSQFIDNISQGLTGTSVALLGYALAKAGILSGGGDDDKEGKYDSQLGKQSYAINIGGKSYSISWLSPTGMPLLVGANLYEKLEEDKDWSFDVVADTLANTLDPMSEMSFLSSLTDVLKSYNTGGTQMIKSMGEAGAQSYILQFFPTLFGQLASTLDDTKRSTKASNNSSWKFGEETIRKIMLKVPGLRNQLEEQTDIWGNAKQQTDNIITRAVESFIAPYSKTEDITSDIDKEIKRVFNKTGETSVIPGIPQAYVKKDDETFKMSASEYTKYKQTFGQTANRTMNELFNSSSYKEVDDDEKAKMIENVYKYAREQAKQEYFNNIKEDYNAKETSKVEKIQDTYGISAGDYYANKDEYSYAEKNPGKYLAITQVADYKDYNEYKSEISRIKKEYDNTNDRKDAVFEYINSLPLNVEQKLILQKTAANYSIKQYRGRLQNYIESLELTAEEKQAIDKVLFD